MTEDEAITRLVDSQGTDQQAATLLIEGQLDRIRGVCRSMVRDEQVALELSQEAVLRIYASLPRFRGDCAWSTWCWRVARNLCLNWLEKRRETLGEEGDTLPDPRPDALADRALLQRRRSVASAIDRVLEPEEADAVRLHYEQGLSVREVTRTLGLENRSGARGVLQRARRKLRKDLAAEMPDDSIVQRWQGREPNLRPMPTSAFSDD